VDNIGIGNTKFSFLYKFNSIVRQVDIRVFNSYQFPFALLYFTGSAEFNEQFRSIAKMNGYKLNEYGLYNLKINKEIPIYSEKDVFDVLSMKYLEPKDRI
jgi:DNA polymerase/3'-5' exonuclease PolX